MSVDEASRVRLFVRLEEVLGHEEANTLMQSIPSLSIDELATKSDIALLRSEMQTIEQRLTAMFHREITQQTKTMIFALVATVVSISSVALFQ